jgi:hypothetical protein
MILVDNWSSRADYSRGEKDISRTGTDEKKEISFI